MFWFLPVKYDVMVFSYSMMTPAKSYIYIYKIYNDNGPQINPQGTLHSLPFLSDKFINTLRPRQNGRHFADDTFKCIFVNENARILIQISLKLVHKGPFNNIPALVQITAWRRPGAKPLSEPMMIRLPMHIYVTRPQWVKLKVCVYHILISQCNIC